MIMMKRDQTEVFVPPPQGQGHSVVRGEPAPFPGLAALQHCHPACSGDIDSRPRCQPALVMAPGCGHLYVKAKLVNCVIGTKAMLVCRSRAYQGGR